MSKHTLFISFWDIGLSNLPEGYFKNTQLSPQEAKNVIANAHTQKSLMGVSRADLLAPNGKRKLKKQQELIDVLKNKYQIDLNIKEFFSTNEHEGEPYTTIMPLNIVTIAPAQSLMVVNCHSELTGERNLQEGDLGFRLAPETVEFNLFEAV